jgi:hypothetical protein
MFQQLTLEAWLPSPPILPILTTKSLPWPAVDGITWLEVTDLARGVGFTCPVAVFTDLRNQLNDQALYDLLWLAWHTLSLNGEEHVRFTLELEHKAIRLQAVVVGKAVFIGRPNDF